MNPAFANGEGCSSKATRRVHYDLVDLRLFQHVVEAGSITAGAARAHLALAAASTRIRNMEAATGVALLVRARRGIAPTPAGRALLHHARIVLQQIERMRGDLGDFARGYRGEIRLLANTVSLSEFLPDRLAAFLAAHPAIAVAIEERTSYEIVNAVATGETELGIAADTVGVGALDTLPFAADRLVLVTAATHSLATRRQVDFAEILDEPFIGLAEGSALPSHIAGHAARLGRRIDYRVRLRSFDAMCRMVEHGVGIAIVPEAAARRCRRSMAIRRIALADRWTFRNIVICFRRWSELSAHARLLAESLRAGDGGG
jgi:DNA-binding transcriptional LysR family regulator